MSAPPPGSYPGQQPPAPGYGPPPQPPKKSNTGKIILIICLALVGLCFVMAIVGVIAGGGSKTTTDAGSGSGSAVTTAPAKSDNGPGSSKDNPAPVGTEITPAKDWYITVVSADTNANAALAKENQFNKPQTAGDQFVVVTVKVRNGSSKPDMLAANLQIGLLEPHGTKLMQAFAVTGNQLDITARLQPGGTTTGKLVYELPAADVDKAVLLVEPTLTLDVNEDQRFLALK